MSTLILSGGTAILESELLENSRLVCDGDEIVEISSGAPPCPGGNTVIDTSGCYIAPGYIDIHVHGGAGSDFMDGTVEAVETAVRAHARHGTTTIFPTTTTGSATQIQAMIQACLDCETAALPTIGGIHLYGPYFAPGKVGCHSLAGTRVPNATEYEAYFRSGSVKIATCAAELPGSSEFYAVAAANNCLITCGHSNASWREMQIAFDLGMRHVDHFWCAMSSVPSLRERFGVPMQASMAEFVLMQDEMSTEVIADGWHLSPELLEFAYRMKGADRLCLVTDCNRALDMPEGEYRFGNARDGSPILSDGRVGWALDKSSLASSVVGMDHMVRTMHNSCSATLAETVRMATLTPARRVGMDHLTGSIATGKRADLVVLNRDLQVERLFIRGREFDLEPNAG